MLHNSQQDRYSLGNKCECKGRSKSHHNPENTSQAHVGKCVGGTMMLSVANDEDEVDEARDLRNQT